VVGDSGEDVGNESVSAEEQVGVFFVEGFESFERVDTCGVSGSCRFGLGCAGLESGVVQEDLFFESAQFW